jgi:hypothetical protein
MFENQDDYNATRGVGGGIGGIQMRCKYYGNVIVAQRARIWKANKNMIPYKHRQKKGNMGIKRKAELYREIWRHVRIVYLHFIYSAPWALSRGPYRVRK